MFGELPGSQIRFALFWNKIAGLPRYPKNFDTAVIRAEAETCCPNAARPRAAARVTACRSARRPTPRCPQRFELKNLLLVPRRRRARVGQGAGPRRGVPRAGAGAARRRRGLGGAARSARRRAGDLRRPAHASSIPSAACVRRMGKVASTLRSNVATWCSSLLHRRQPLYEARPHETLAASVGGCRGLRLGDDGRRATSRRCSCSRRRRTR